MGYKDYAFVLSSSQALTGDANSTNFLDMNRTNPPWMGGTPLAVVVTIEAVDVASTGIAFELVHKTSEPTTGDGAIATFTLLAADLTKGKEIVLPLPQGMTMLRYFRIYYNLTNGAERYTVSAYLVPFASAQGKDK